MPQVQELKNKRKTETFTFEKNIFKATVITTEQVTRFVIFKFICGIVEMIDFNSRL